MKMKFTFWKAVFLLIVAAGAYGTYVRFFHGLGASTNLSDQFPWGIWIGFDVLCGVMLAAGGFTLTAAVHILNIQAAEADRSPNHSYGVPRLCIGQRGAAYSTWAGRTTYGIR